ncbi:unnamed protein product [Ostreobium quekettii]|uniref:Uncharacterized protein n=1 Tax=Ostreobium quekettii TaxID=121088 RepID=A0A8S1IMM2_9CHLO|nr:unnamed protein product [Ostreobium quekettii]
MIGVRCCRWDIAGIVTLCAPPTTYYRISEEIDEVPAHAWQALFGGYCCCLGFPIRTKLRKKYNLQVCPFQCCWRLLSISAPFSPFSLDSSKSQINPLRTHTHHTSPWWTHAWTGGTTLCLHSPPDIASLVKGPALSCSDKYVIDFLLTHTSSGGASLYAVASWDCNTS